MSPVAQQSDFESARVRKPGVCPETARRDVLQISPLTRREYRFAVATWQEIIRTFPWESAPRGPGTSHAATIDVLAALTVAICDYETSSAVRRLRARLTSAPEALSVTAALARYPCQLANAAVRGG
jgi:hypothetical protein